MSYELKVKNKDRIFKRYLTIHLLRIKRWNLEF